MFFWKYTSSTNLFFIKNEFHLKVFFVKYTSGCKNTIFGWNLQIYLQKMYGISPFPYFLIMKSTLWNISPALLSIGVAESGISFPYSPSAAPVIGRSLAGRVSYQDSPRNMVSPMGEVVTIIFALCVWVYSLSFYCKGLRPYQHECTSSDTPFLWWSHL